MLLALVPPTNPSNIPLCDTGIADSESSEIYFSLDAPLTIIYPMPPKAHVDTATGTIQHSVGRGKISIPQISEEIQTVHLIPTLKHTIIVIGKICDANCKVTFTKDDVAVYDKQDKPILKGWRERIGAKMWRFAMHQNSQSNVVGEEDMTFHTFSA